MEPELFRLGYLAQVELVGRAAFAAVIGGFIGFERRHGDHPAGIRTLALVSMGSAIFTLVSIYGFQVPTGEWVRDPARVAAQVATGVGFIGAGTILRSGGVVRGLSTATGIWTAAALGMAAGTGMYVLALSGTLLTVLILFFFRRRRGHGINQGPEADDDP